MDEDDSQSAAWGDEGNLRLFDATFAHTGRRVKKRSEELSASISVALPVCLLCEEDAFSVW